MRKGSHHTEASKAKLKGRKFSEETRSRMSTAAKHRWTNAPASLIQEKADILRRYRASIPNVRQHDLNLLKKAVKAAAKKRKNEPFTGKKREAVLKNLEAAAKANAKSLRFISSLEKQICQELKQMGIRFQHHRVFGYFTTDFYFPQCKLDLEIDGGYWHEKFETKEKDKRKEGFLSQKGIRTVHLKIRGKQPKLHQILTQCLRKEGVPFG